METQAFTLCDDHAYTLPAPTMIPRNVLSYGQTRLLSDAHDFARAIRNYETASPRFYARMRDAMRRRLYTFPELRSAVADYLSKPVARFG